MRSKNTDGWHASNDACSLLLEVDVRMYIGSIRKRNMRSSTLDHEKALAIVNLMVDHTAEEVLMGLTR
jgi:hypothetical protein